MGKKVGFSIALILGLILVDVFARFIYSQSWYGDTKLSKEVDPFDIITLVVTTVVTLWLGWYVAKKVTEQRYQKEYIISDLKQIEEEIKMVERSIENSKEVELQVGIALSSKLKRFIDRFSMTVEVFKITTINVELLNQNHKRLYIKFTNLEGDKLILDETNRNEIHHIFSDLIMTTRKMIFNINSY